jgi:4-diphosphocytidyl-2-C-methyl-D-erythritol kinase
MELTEIAKSKINLSLNLSGIKSEGYHDLISFICFGSFSDQLRLKPSKSFSYEINSSMKDITFKDDLVLKVIHKIKKIYDLEDLPKIDLILEKNIPLGSGLGGGSADAAATIRLMNKFLDLGMNQDEMCSFGMDLGTDIPACIISEPLVAYGAGERIVKVDFEKKYQMLIVYPNIEISTKEVFKLVKPVKSKILDLNKTKKTIDLFNSDNNDSFLKNLSNDLQVYATEAYPILKSVIDVLNLNKSFFSRMTGSGSACFGLFEDKFIDKAIKNITKEYPDWIVKKTILNDL